MGGRAYVVGGGVRDHLRGLPTHDWDIEVFGVAQEELEKLLQSLGAVHAVGRAFGVYKWKPRRTKGLTLDVSIPRRDSKVGPGHKGIAVMGDPDMPVEEAARRRDLTINALMWDIVEQRLVDPWNGLRDLEAGILRAVDPDTFLEDPLRALRVVQFAARFEFVAAPELITLCRRAALDELPAERVQGEWAKLLLKGVRPSAGFAVARAADITARVFPEVASLETDLVVDALAHSRRAEVLAGSEGRAWVLMLAGWLHPASLEAVHATLDRLWLHTWGGYPLRERLDGVVRAWRDPASTDTELRRLSTRAEPELVLMLQQAIDGTDRTPALDRARALGVATERPAPLLLGRHLQAMGVPPGPAMGRILAAVYDLQLEGQVTDLDAALAAGRRLASS
jgi:tRNA nucleotidyltransferase (CCA-adding enzyme)